MLLALVRLLRTHTATLVEGEDEDECMSIDLAELYRTLCD